MILSKISPNIERGLACFSNHPVEESDTKIFKRDSNKSKLSIIEVESNSDLQEELKILFDSSKDGEEDQSKCTPKSIFQPSRLSKNFSIFALSDSGIPNTSGHTSPQQSSKFRVNISHIGSQKSQETQESLRKREVALAKISLYIVLVFLFCHIIRIIPNAYEMIQSYHLGVSQRNRIKKKQDYRRL